MTSPADPSIAGRFPTPGGAVGASLVVDSTFFRHFADKREVLFGGADALQDLLVNAVAGAPDSAADFKTSAVGL